jgi:hypothetical protein
VDEGQRGGEKHEQPIPAHTTTDGQQKGTTQRDRKLEALSWVSQWKLGGQACMQSVRVHARPSIAAPNRFIIFAAPHTISTALILSKSTHLADLSQCCLVQNPLA